MELQTVQNGYVVQLYQYARRYRYNNDGCLRFFNHTIDRRERLGIEKYTLDVDFLVFGDFDLLQITSVDSFRQYHDVPELAKDWLGKRQSVLLYDISSPSLPTRIYYDEGRRLWKKAGTEGAEAKFFCLSMLSLTNEIVENTENISDLLSALRKKILLIVDELNSTGVCKLECEVFGTFNTSELGIVWLSDQYVDVLQMLDYIKHIKIVSFSEHPGETPRSCSAFFASFSTIAIKEATDPQGVRGNALIQIAVHDVTENYDQLQQFARKLVGDESGQILYSVGEYDLIVEVSAKRAIELIQHKGELNIGTRERKTGKFLLDKIRPILRNNTRLLYNKDDTADLKAKLDALYQKGGFSITWTKPFKDFTHYFEWTELKQSEETSKKVASNADYFRVVRQGLKKLASPSAGAVDTLDLLYTDYHSAISTAYSAMWVSDLHRQFKAVLHEINLLISSEELEWSWDRYRDLTNAFKQQIYHLTQSNRMFFETPSCHLRATGQYDFLMHAYYGITKRILEAIYLMQGSDAQSELVPLITVNTVPQVRTQLYFEIGDDDRRVINLDIPNSIIFDLQRGSWYLAHELFHYAVPQKRKERNYRMGVFLLTLIFRQQFLRVFRNLLSMRIDGTVDPEAEVVVNQLLGDREGEGIDVAASFYERLDQQLLDYVKEHFDHEIRPNISYKEDALCSQYQLGIYDFAGKSDSEFFYLALFKKLFPVCEIFLSIDSKNTSNSETMDRVKDRIKYCLRNDVYIVRFVQSNFTYRTLNSDLMPDTWAAIDTWAAVREACADVAMVSLNCFGIVDYMLFCIQAWTDANNDRLRILEKMEESDAQCEWIRFSLVAEYFLTQSRPGWNNYKAESDYTELSEEIGKEFCKRYVWFYAKSNMKRPREEEKAETAQKFQDLLKAAENWLLFFASCKRFFQKELALYYDDIFAEIICDFDVERRISRLKNQGHSDYAQQLERIQTEFREQVYQPYSELFKEIPADYVERFSAASSEQIAKYDIIYKNLRFSQDIAAAQHFQKQKSLCELGELNLKVQAKASVVPPEQPSQDGQIPKPPKDAPEGADRCWKFHVHSLTELLFYISFCFDKLKETALAEPFCKGQRQSTSVWFRGHTSEAYKLIPTVMRNFRDTEKDKKCSKYQNLRRFQRSNFEEFKFRADGAPEMPTGLRFTRSDYLAMMQHYGAPTNFLDWTENAFTSLYLALKYYFGGELKDGDKTYRNVTLFMFHPGVYNSVRQQCLCELRAKSEDWVKNFPIVAKTLDEKGDFINLIPNLSIEANEEYYNMFLLGDIGEEKFFASGDDLYKAYSKAHSTEMRDLFMPIAVLTSRLNHRIRTQCGSFVAYNLYTPPITDKDLDSRGSLFDYISLEEIQERKKDKGIFMYQITIDKKCCQDVVKWLETLGISRENVYPELSEKGYYFD